MALPPTTRASVVRGGLVALAAAVAGFVGRPGRRRRRRAEAGTAAANAYGTAPAGGRRLAALADVPPDGGLVLADEGVVLVRGEGDEVHALLVDLHPPGLPGVRGQRRPDHLPVPRQRLRRRDRRGRRGAGPVAAARRSTWWCRTATS